MTNTRLNCLIGSTLLHMVLFILIARMPGKTHEEMHAVEAFIVESPVARVAGTRPDNRRAIGSGPKSGPQKPRPETAKREPVPQVESSAAPPAGQHDAGSASPSLKVPAATEHPLIPGKVSVSVARSSGADSGPGSPAAKPLSPIPQGGKEPGSAPVSSLPGPGTGEVMELGKIGAPRFIHREEPSYPFIARRLGKEGKVVLKLALDARGQLQEVQVMEANGFGFAESASAAIRKSTFAPAIKSGKAVSSHVLVPVRFVLRDGR